MLLQATLNGPLTKDDHPGVPVTAEELALDAAACLAAGAGAFHVHPRDETGAERLDSDVVNGVVATVRAAADAPIGVSTGAWIEPDLERRISMIRGWVEPDFASVNVAEDGAAEVMAALLVAGVGIEAGVWTVEDVERLEATGLAGRVTRVMIEPVDVSATEAPALVDAIHRELDSRRIDAPRLQHGDGESTWVLLDDAFARGIAMRIGLEDTFYEPDGQLAHANASLVRTARARALTGGR